MAEGGASDRGSVQHHCPRAKFGGPSCQRVKENHRWYCKTHQWQCPEHPDLRPLLNQPCRSCEMRDRIVPEQEERKAKREEIETTNQKIAKYNVKNYTPPE